MEEEERSLQPGILDSIFLCLFCAVIRATVLLAHLCRERGRECWRNDELFFRSLHFVVLRCRS